MNELDLRCFCEECEARTKEIYHLNVSCWSCGWSGIAILRKGDRHSCTIKCPHCECMFTLEFGQDPCFKESK